ncbi:MAG: hypothetical protein IJB68_02530 [Ruminococcus sp.]|nr:hypothetical protein [Ruminococcus sp.]
MKKNKSMRAAGGLMIATLLSTSIVSGTYAKYVTSDSAKDSARVAKFGVEVKADGTLFGKNYLEADENSPTTDTTGITVKSLSDPADNVVAPGTKNDKGISFSVTGQPEVDVTVKIDIKNTSDVWLGKGTYPNMTNGDVFDNKYVADNDIFTTTDAYYPIKYTLTKGSTQLVNGGNLDAVIKALNTALNGTGSETVYKAGTDLSKALGNFQLTWEWDFDASGAGTNDKQDTLLGDLAAGNVGGAVTAINDAITTANIEGVNAITLPEAGNGVTAAADSYNLNTSLEFTITVTQID